MRVVRSALGAALGFAWFAAGTAWAKPQPFDCHAIANECYTQSFRGSSVPAFNALEWRGYWPPALASVLLVVVPGGALLLAGRRSRAVAIGAFPLMIAICIFAMRDRPAMALPWRSGIGGVSVPAAGFWLAVASVVATGVAMVSAVTVRQSSGSASSDEPG